MRLLLCSDIHSNIHVVERMRGQEKNDFDAIIIAGDIGSSKAKDIFKILSTFGCPILFVYGNWDSRLTYDAAFEQNCHHLHLSPFRCGPWTFVGFSGCPTNWGQNPIALQCYSEVSQMHSNVLRQLSEAEEEARHKRNEIASAFAIQLSEMEARAIKRGKVLGGRTREILKRREEEQATEPKFNECINLVKNSAEYRRYKYDRSNIKERILSSNRNYLLKIMNEIRCSPELTFIVTHERLRKVHQDFIGLAVSNLKCNTRRDSGCSDEAAFQAH